MRNREKVQRKEGCADVVSNRQVWPDCAKTRKHSRDSVFACAVGKPGRQ